MNKLKMTPRQYRDAVERYRENPEANRLDNLLRAKSKADFFAMIKGREPEDRERSANGTVMKIRPGVLADILRGELSREGGIKGSRKRQDASEKRKERFFAELRLTAAAHPEKNRTWIRSKASKNAGISLRQALRYLK